MDIVLPVIIATPNLEADFGDEDNMLQVEIELSDILSSFHSPSTVDVVSIHPDQIRRAIKSLSHKKAAGPDLLTSEHFLMGPVDVLSQYLSVLFSA